MRVICFTAVLLVLFCYVKSELLMVLETFRHGAREPLFDWWNARNFTHWGELTPVGMRQHYNLGKVLRKIYIEELHFLSPAFNPDEIYVRSTDVNRTLVSALSQLYGLYPLGSGPELPFGLDPALEQAPFAGFLNESEGFFGLPFAFQPIPIHTVPTKEEFLLRSFDRICNVSQDLQKIIQESDVYQAWQKEFQPTFQELGRILNLTEEKTKSLTLEDASDIFDVFLDDKWSNGQLPANISKELWTNLTLIYNFVIYYSLGGIRNISQFYATPFFREVVQSLDAKLANVEHPLKWKIYSAHDWTVATFTTGLNITDYKCTEELIRSGKTNALNCFLYPDFATNLIIELHKEEQEPFVKIRYNGNYVNLCEKNETQCSYSEFKNRLENYLVDFEEICKQTHFYADKPNIEINGFLACLF